MLQNQNGIQISLDSSIPRYSMEQNIGSGIWNLFDKQ